MASQHPVQLGIAGIGGYAGTIRNLVLSDGATSDPPVRLVAVCDPAPSAFPDVVSELEEAGTTIYDDYGALLAHPGLEAVWLPVPIDLHRPFAEQALAAGKAVMCEKPIAGSIDDLNAMIEARDAAGLPFYVGFQDIYCPATMPLKQKLLAGAIGKIKRASVHACWPRDNNYFSRASWVGRIRRGDTWVLDSPLANALAHFVNLPLFLMGDEVDSTAKPVSLEAELYRAAPIENYDTISTRIQLASGASLLVLLTHAATETKQPIVVLEGEKGELRMTTDRWTLTTPAGVTEGDRGNRTPMRPMMLQRFARAVRGIADPDIAAATLESARPHMIVVNGVSQAATITSVPDENVYSAEASYEGTILAIKGIEDGFGRAAEKWQMLHESGLFPFTQPAGTIDLQGYKHFAGPAEPIPAG